MSDDNQHNRTMNLNAHFAWGFALWASADASRIGGNLMLAPIGYYYACFHSSYAYLNAVPGIDPNTFDHMGHSQLSNLIGQHLSANLKLEFDEMRELREAINYLGLGDPSGKLRVLRGHALRFGTREKSISFDESIIKSRDILSNGIGTGPLIGVQSGPLVEHARRPCSARRSGSGWRSRAEQGARMSRAQAALTPGS